jgi:hypothetical protein
MGSIILLHFSTACVPAGAVPFAMKNRLLRIRPIDENQQTVASLSKTQETT